MEGDAFDADIFMVRAGPTADARLLACSPVMVKCPNAEERVERVLR
jgi:hypothetical protein